MNNSKGIKQSQFDGINEILKVLDINGPKQNSLDSCKHDNQNEQKKDDHCDHCDHCGPCDLCANLNADPADMEKHGARLLNIRIKVTNVCCDKEVCVACIIYDKCGRILAFRGFTTMLDKDDKCGKNECGTIERKLLFVLPDDDMSDPLDLEIRTKANYIHPCE